MDIDPIKIEELKAKIEARRAEMLADWTPEICPVEHQDGWLAWEYVGRVLKERGVNDDHILMLKQIWMGKVRNRLYGTYGAIVTMLETPSFIEE